jgi:predicted transcriptional regulator
LTVRKNFNFDETVAKHLEEIAKEEGKTQTQIAQEAIEERYRQMSNKKKLEIFDEIQDAFHGLLTDVDAKAARIEQAVEKYGI